MATFEQVMKIMGVMTVAFPAFQLKPETIEAYADLLADVDADLLSVAAKQAMVESKFYPSIAELRERVLAMRKAASNVPDAYAAWSEIMGEVRRVGYESWPDAQWSCDIVRDAARRWWRDICLGNEDDLPTVRAQFRDAYNAQTRRAEDEARRLPVTNDAIKRLAAAMSLPARLNGKHTPELDPDRDLESEGEH